MQALILSQHTSSVPRVGSKYPNIFFLKVLCHVAYQIKGNEAQSTRQAHILSLHTPSTRGVGSKGQNIFSECGYVAFQIKGKEEQTSIEKTLTLYTPLTLGQVERSDLDIEIVTISIFFY